MGYTSPLTIEGDNILFQKPEHLHVFCGLRYRRYQTMKTEIKTRIRELRSEGYGYKRIAKTLDLTLSVVRYAVNKMSDEDLLEGRCEKCGIKIKSIKGKKRKRFCSDRCRWDWWNKHQKEVDKKAFYTHVCKWCNQEFTSYGNNRRVYCSHDCYIKFKLNKGETQNGSQYCREVFIIGSTRKDHV